MTGALGTYQWMAPEVLTSQRYSEKADVYSFGMVRSQGGGASLQSPLGLSPGEIPKNVYIDICPSGSLPSRYQQPGNLMDCS